MGRYNIWKDMGGWKLNNIYYAPPSSTGKVDNIYISGTDIVPIVLDLRTAGVKHIYHKQQGKVEMTSKNFASAHFVLRDKYEFEKTKKVETRIKAIEKTLPPKMEVKEEVVYPEFKVPPRHAQSEAVLYGLKNKRFLLGDIMGTGKTGSAIFLAEFLKANFGFKHTLVINGISGNQFSWVDEVHKFSNEKPYILGTRVKTKGENKGEEYIGSVAERMSDLSKDIDAFFLITNIMTLRDDNFIKALHKRIASGEIGFVVIDEVHACANLSSMQGKNLAKIKTEYMLAMSGTPFKDPEDMYAIESLLGQTFLPKQDYLEQFGEFTVTKEEQARAIAQKRFPMMTYSLTKPSAFKHNMSRYLLRRTEVLDELPPITFIDKYVELGPEQKALYREAESELPMAKLLDLNFEQMEEELSKSSYIQTKQVLSCPHIFGKSNDAKLEAVEEMLEEILSNGKTAIVFTTYIETASNYKDKLSKKFPNKGAYVTSDITDLTQVNEEVSKFSKGDKQFLVGSVRKIGTGFNLQKADYVIFSDRPDTWRTYEQNYMRAWRQGRKDPVIVVKVLAKGTIDDKISFRLHEQKAATDLILGKTQHAEGVIDKDIEESVNKGLL